jgi:hypothetical protein
MRIAHSPICERGGSMAAPSSSCGSNLGDHRGGASYQW